MTVITFASLKGGSGKTTLALHLAHSISLANKRVLLVDADPQGSSSSWINAREDESLFPVIGLARNSLHRDLPELLKNYDHGVIDTPPRVSTLARSAILAADLVVIPVQPSSFDTWAASETVEVVLEAQSFKPELKAVFVISKKVTGTAIGRAITAALKDYSFPVLKASISQRTKFAESSIGYSVMELEPSGKAALEIKNLSSEILKVLGMEKW